MQATLEEIRAATTKLVTEECVAKEDNILIDVKNNLALPMSRIHVYQATGGITSKIFFTKS